MIWLQKQVAASRLEAATTWRVAMLGASQGGAWSASSSLDQWEIGQNAAAQHRYHPENWFHIDIQA